MMWRSLRAILAPLFVAVVLLGAVAPANASTSRPTTFALQSTPGRFAHLSSQGQDVCAQNVPAGVAHCDSVLGVAPAVLPNQVSVSTPAVSTLGDDGAYSPSYLQSAYDVASASRTNAGGAGQIVAIVDAYGDPTIVSDLAYYRSFFKLSPCPVGVVGAANPSCALQVANESGAASPLPPPNTSWGLEESIDADMVSAICPKCQILLIETSSAAISDLGAGVNTAVGLGATVVSNSYGSTEYPSEVADTNAYFDHPGVAIVAASGGAGYGVQFPAASPDVVAVGGTSLVQRGDAGARDGTSTVWSDTGAGCSAYEPKPSWQVDTGCANRSDNDVAAVADPTTGVWVYDTTGFSGLVVAGGTSVATPIIGSLYALAGPFQRASDAAQSLYVNHDELTSVVIGSDGPCATYLCDAAHAQGNYNGPTGLGTPTVLPNSAGAFVMTSDAAVTTTPDRPTLTTADASPTSVALSWTPPTGSSVAPSGYEVLEGDNGAAPAPPPINTSPVTTNRYVVENLTYGERYSFSVEAIGAGGTSPPSNTLSVFTSTVAGMASAPLDVVASPGQNLAVITWSRPASSGATPITSFDVTDHANASCVDVVANGPVNSCTADGLNAGESYVFYVAANNNAGASPWSSASVAVTLGGVPGPPVDVTAVSGDQSATVSWDPPLAQGGSAIVGYRASDASGHVCSVAVTASAQDSCVIDGLTNGDSYQFVVTSTNSAGTSAGSALSAPVLIATNTPALSVSAGENFACALFRGGTVRCWGDNNYGQLGNGTFVSSATQVQVHDVAGATQVSSGINSACAVIAHGAVKCWGANTFSQLGDDSTNDAPTPVSVRGLTGVRVLTSGFQFRCALLRGGAVKCWGYNDNGQLGNGTYVTERTPVVVRGLTGATTIVVDEDHACAIVANGVVKCWGANEYGQLGDRSRAVSRVPVTVRGLRGVTAIGVGFSNTCALLRDRTVACWGYNGDGELGDTTTVNEIVPTLVAGVTNVVKLADGNFNSCAEMVNGSVKCWGFDSSTTLSDNATSTAAPSAPALNLEGNLTLSLDSGYSCSLLANQTVECWVDGSPTVNVLWFPDRASPSAPNPTNVAVKHR